ncbi:unnamed protein product [Brassicogethes aeneus]|uniref:Uncharacterized protein n=1 Tax=Brassicogethes aeneus TaxID=1431903 RepID=A0A9P0ATM7_BRAAE|nr:unnamed protein product [Brassicogethes aeneus]
MNKTKSKSKRQKRKQKVLRDREYENILEKSDKCLNKIPQKRFFSHEIPPQYRERVQLLNQHIQHSLAHYYKHGKNYFEPLIKLLFDFPISQERFKTIITISITTTNSDPYKPQEKLDIMYFLKHLNSTAHGIFREDKDVSVNILLNMLRPKEFFNKESSQKHDKSSGIVKKNTPLKTDLKKEQERPGNKINEENTLPSISKIVENNKNKLNKIGNENKKIKLLDYLENLFESGRLDSDIKKMLGDQRNKSTEVSKESTPRGLNSRKNEHQGSIQTNQNDDEKKEGEWKEVTKKDKICNKVGKRFEEFKINDNNKNIKELEAGNKTNKAKTLSSKSKRMATKIEGNNKNKSSEMVPKKENKIDNLNNENKTSGYLENLCEFGSFDSDLKKMLNIQIDKSIEISKESTQSQKNEHQGSIETNENDDEKKEGEWKEVTKKDKICNKMGKYFAEFKLNDYNKNIKDFEAGNKTNETKTLLSKSKKMGTKIVGNNKNKSSAMGPKKENKMDNINNENKTSEYLENLSEFGSFDSNLRKVLNIQTDKSVEISKESTQSQKNEHQGSIETNENDDEKKEGEWKEVTKKDKICNKVGKSFAEFKINDNNKNIKDFEGGNKINETKTLLSKSKKMGTKIVGNNKNKSSAMVAKKENKMDNMNNENKTSEYLENLCEFGSFDSDLKKMLNIQTDKSTEISKESTEYQKNEHQGSIETNENDDEKKEGEWKEVTKRGKIYNKMNKRFAEFKINDYNENIEDFEAGNKINKPTKNKNKSAAIVPKKENKEDNKNNGKKSSEYLENHFEFGTFDSDFKKMLNIQTEISKESQKNENRGSIETNENGDEKDEGEWKKVTKKDKICNRIFKIKDHNENIRDFDSDSDQTTKSEKTKSKKKRKKASKQNDYFVKNANDNQKSKNTNENEEGERKNIKENFNENINFADLELPMKIHGIGSFYESDNFSEDGFSDFDDDYYKYLPPPIKINPEDVVVIIARLN